MFHWRVTFYQICSREGSPVVKVGVGRWIVYSGSKSKIHLSWERVFRFPHICSGCWNGLESWAIGGSRCGEGKWFRVFYTHPEKVHLKLTRSTICTPVWENPTYFVRKRLSTLHQLSYTSALDPTFPYVFFFFAGVPMTLWASDLISDIMRNVNCSETTPVSIF